MKKPSILIAPFLLICVSVVGCQITSPRKSITDFNQESSVGQEFRNTIVMGGKVIPIPEGNWTIVSKETALHETKYIGGSGGPTVDQNLESSSGSLMLASFDNDTLDGLMLISTRLSSKRFGAWVSGNFCKRTPVKYIDVISDKDKSRECWWVSDVRITQQDIKRTLVKDGLDYLVSTKNVSLPSMFAQVAIYVSRHSDYLFISYNWNSDSDKTKTEINNLISWGKSWHPKIVSAVENRQ